MELPVCSQDGRHHFSLCITADSPLPGPYRDLDHPRKHSTPLPLQLNSSTSSTHLTSYSPPLHWTPCLHKVLWFLGTLCYPAHCVWPPHCHFLSPLKIHQVPHAHTSHSHHLLQPEMPIFRATIHRLALMSTEGASSTLLSTFPNPPLRWPYLLQPSVLWRFSHTSDV